ncbi:MAG: cupin domain-containing protein [Candidatus Promineifilaceae bacterium]
MYNIIKSDDLQRSPGGTVRFVGEPYGSGASFFLVNAEPGKGASLHRHPYPETWIVQSGQVRFTVGGEDIEASSGDIVVGLAEIPHKFVNIGTDRLKLVCIHPSPQIIQEDLEE